MNLEQIIETIKQYIRETYQAKSINIEELRANFSRELRTVQTRLHELESMQRSDMSPLQPS